ncbi:MAG: UDP-N-acetylmuramoyl-L-alanyl-D-glutamate--2,6-diaminopimelate ligase [Parcubacteria group bacterium]|nr:UDP-N-acetylmuramoyl-L-alanyl-D-glutamate--2,6-diaminopimelate ligase [Parcubacteria group bacterium]
MILVIKKILKKLVPSAVWNSLHWCVALAGAVKNRFPSRDLVVIGVTGTNGKSTVVQLAHDIFSEFGLNVASTSSIRFRLKNKEEVNKLKMTMPGRFALQDFLRHAARAGCQYAILEVTSEGLSQNRAAFINFDGAVLTNVRPEHIESHGSFEKYRQAKGKLFDKLKIKKDKIKKISVINLDDASAHYYSGFSADEKYGYGLLKENGRSEIKNHFIPEDIKFSAQGVDFTLEGEKYRSPLLGDFNLYNVLAAIALARAFEIPHQYIKKSIADFKGAPGRLEVLQTKPLWVCIDYAHTPDALESVYRAAKSFWVNPVRNHARASAPKGPLGRAISNGAGNNGHSSRLICVLGAAGGGRDKWKRPKMGALAQEFCDEIILTDEDPYTEDPEKIVDEVARGIQNKKYKKIMDRRLAIREALRLAQSGDVVLITGKGAEKTMMTRFGALPWDEKAVVLEELGKLNKK